MKKILLVLLGALLYALVSSSAAQETARRILGIYLSSRSIEEFDISVGVTTQNRPRGADRVEVFREQVNLPAHYGELVAVHGGEDVTVLWFQDGGGALRNAVVDRPAEYLYRIQPTAVGKLQINSFR